MTDLPPLVPTQRETRTNLYGSLLDWMSLNRPGYWQLRLDIVILCYIILTIAALLAPAVLMTVFGRPIDLTYNGESVYNAPLGLSADEIMSAFLLTVVLVVIVASLWAYTISRGVQSRYMPVKYEAFSFARLMGVIAPLFLFPLVVLNYWFFLSYDCDFKGLFLGLCEIPETLSPIYVRTPGVVIDEHSSEALYILYGLIYLAIIFVTLVKIIHNIKITGLIKVLFILTILGIVSYYLGKFEYENIKLIAKLYTWREDYNESWSNAGGIQSILVYFLFLSSQIFFIFRDNFVGVAHKYTKINALSVALNVPFFGIILILLLIDNILSRYGFAFDDELSAIVPAILVAVAMFQHFLFKSTARLALLPKP